MGRIVLVAGGTGALGSGVLEALLDAGNEVHATYVADRERNRTEEGGGCAYVGVSARPCVLGRA